LPWVFLDFEASSLSKDSYPIEVGWVFEDGTGEAHLIRPAPGWTDWDARAAAVHGITREQLEREGEPHQTICGQLLTLFEQNTVLASAPSWDGHWLSMLLRASGHPRHLVRLQDTEIAFVAAAESTGAAISPPASKAPGGPPDHRSTVPSPMPAASGRSGAP
jgi:hypothetical protein